MELLVDRSRPLGRLALECAQGLQVPLLLDDTLHSITSQRPDELVLEVLNAHEESERCEVFGP